MSNLGKYMPRSLMDWAPFVGAAVSTSGAILARKYAPAGGWFQSHPEMTGALVSGALGAGLYATKRREAGLMVVLGGVAAALPAIIDRFTGGHGLSGLGYYAAETANPLLGMVRADQLQGMGYATASPQPPAYGTVPGVAGALAGPMQDHGGGAPVNLLGGDTQHMSLARHYGATHMG